VLYISITYYFIFEHSLLYAYQSGFINGHSTVYQLLEMYHRVCQNLEERLSTIIKSKFFPEYDNEVSSANSLAKLPKLSVMSLIYNKNNKGPSTDPWGTPALTRPEFNIL
jgi:hypothetical protein